MNWEDVRVQLVDLPPVSADFFEPWVPSVIRSADAALLVVDLASDDVHRRRRRPPSIGSRERIPSSSASCPFDVEDETVQHVKTVMVANKLDAEGAADRLEVVREWFGGRFPMLAVSAATRGRSGRLASRLVRSIGSPSRLHESPWQAGGSAQAVHDPHRKHGPGPRPGGSPGLRALVEVRPGLGHRRLRGADGQARP